LLFSPPHYSDLQPIEIVWANVKGQIGRQYNTETTFADVLVRLQAAFDGLQSRTVQGCINKTNKHLAALHKHIFALDAAEDAVADAEEDENDDHGSRDGSDDDGEGSESDSDDNSQA